MAILRIDLKFRKDKFEVWSSFLYCYNVNTDECLASVTWKKNTGNRIIFEKKVPRKTNQIIFADNQYFLSWARITAGLTTQ